MTEIAEGHVFLAGVEATTHRSNRPSVYARYSTSTTGSCLKMGERIARVGYSREHPPVIGKESKTG